MNIRQDLDWFKDELRKQVKEIISISIDEPELVSGINHIDITVHTPKGNKRYTLAWQIGRGFGFYADDAQLGENPERCVEDREKALEETITLLRKLQAE